MTWIICLVFNTWYMVQRLFWYASNLKAIFWRMYFVLFCWWFTIIFLSSSEIPFSIQSNLKKITLVLKCIRIKNQCDTHTNTSCKVMRGIRSSYCKCLCDWALLDNHFLSVLLILWSILRGVFSKVLRSRCMTASCLNSLKTQICLTC